MSYIQDVGAMLRYQNQIEKEKQGQSEHPATTLQRQRYERKMEMGQTLRPAAHGSRRKLLLRRMISEAGSSCKYFSR